MPRSALSVTVGGVSAGIKWFDLHFTKQRAAIWPPVVSRHDKLVRGMRHGFGATCASTRSFAHASFFTDPASTGSSLSRRTRASESARQSAAASWSASSHRASCRPKRQRRASAPNAFIRIDQAGKVTLVMPQVEMGQGAYTSISMILAEEARRATGVRSSMSMPHPAMRSYGNPVFGLQATGNSNSIRAFWLPLRKAAARHACDSGPEPPQPAGRVDPASLPHRGERGDP